MLKQPFFASSILYALLICLTSCSHNKNSETDNCIKLGSAHVSVKLIDTDNSKPWPDSLIIEVGRPAFLADSDNPMPVTRRLDYDGNIWQGDIPMELLRTNAGAIIISHSSGRIIYTVGLGLDQQHPADVELWRDNDSIISGRCKGGNGMFITDQHYGNIISDFIAMGPIAPKEAYQASPKEYLHHEMDSILPLRMNEAIGTFHPDPEIKKMLENNMKRIYFSGRIMHFADDAKWFHNIELSNPDPPMEYYSEYLKTIDYSTLLLEDSDMGLLTFLQHILNNLPVRFPPIGETDIPQWQHKVNQIIKPAIPQTTTTLLNLLTAASYITQIEQAHIPLSEKQKNIILAYFTDDLGKIIINRNTSIFNQDSNLKNTNLQY